MQQTTAGSRDERGETLIELVVAVAILGIAGVAVLSGLLLSVKTSTQHRNMATGGAYVRSFAEAIQNKVDDTGFASCASAVSTYQGVTVTDLPGGYAKEVLAVQSWDGSAWGTCTDKGVQRLNLRVTTPGDTLHRAQETLTVVLRQPCNGPVPTSTSNPCA